MRLSADKWVSTYIFIYTYFTMLIMNLSRDIVKGILPGSSHIFLVESSSDGWGLPRQWKDLPAWMRLCPVSEAVTTDSPSELGSAFVGVISRSLAGKGLDGLFKPLWGLLTCERRVQKEIGRWIRVVFAMMWTPQQPAVLKQELSSIPV